MRISKQLETQLEDIPELEDDKENWQEGKFVDVDFIDHHNTLRKVIEYVVSTLQISRRLQTLDTVLRIIEHQDSNTISLNQNIIL